MIISQVKYLSVIALVVACCTFLSCGEEPTAQLEPEPAEPVFDISFSVGMDGVAGLDTITSPIVARQGDTLSLSITQTSSYTTPDGNVFTCEPQAVIKLFTPNETLYVKDFKALGSITEKPKLTSKKESDQKLTQQTLQTFSVGGKDIIFDLAYDIYYHSISNQQSIEMPYIKLNPANYGSVYANKTKGTPVLSITGIRLTPREPQTKGTIVDSTAYNVNVAFNLQIESVNTNDPQKQTLSFEVEFPAVVESTTEYPDPEMLFNYQLNVLEGTTSAASPFTLTNGLAMSFEWAQTCRYNYFSVSKDTVWASNQQELETLIASEAIITQAGESTSVTQGQKVFSINDLDITLNWNYESIDRIEAEGAIVSVPHLELGEPQIVSVKANELSEVGNLNRTVKIYEVTVRIQQELKSVNAPQEQVKTIEYIVKYTGAVEVNLVKVVYRKGWEWVDSHDNILLAYYPIVYRDRIYSTGETFTDTFNGGGYLTDMRMPFNFAGDFIENVSDGQVIRKVGQRRYEDSISICIYVASVPDLSRVYNVHDAVPRSEYLSYPPGTWEEYETAKLYSNQDLSLENVEVFGADSLSEKASGWYFYSPDYCYKGVALNYGDELRLLDGGFRIGFYDAYLSIDGRMINFLAFRGPMQFETHKEDITMPNGAPGIVYTSEFRRTFLSKNFYAWRIDSVYQQDP